jgi:ribosomal protein S18 acetylase RimI-like enzyme
MEIERDKIKYRRATESDVKTLIDYRMRFLDALFKHQAKSETEILRKSLRRYFSKAIPSGNLIAWLAEYEGNTLGTGCMVIWEIPGRYGGIENGKLGYILNMYTVPEARKMGICTRLLAELMNEAKSRGLKYLHLHASKDGIKIYRKAGFIEPFNLELVLRF